MKLEITNVDAEGHETRVAAEGVYKVEVSTVADAFDVVAHAAEVEIDEFSSLL